MKNRLPLIAWAALPLSIGLAFAAQPQRVQPVQPGQTQQQPNQQGQQGQNLDQPGIPQTQKGQSQNGQRPAAPQGSGTNYADVFLQKLAAQLGIGVDRLKAAAAAAGSATIDQGVQAGDLPSDRAAEMKGRLSENPFAFGGPGGPGGHGPHGHGGPGENRDGGRDRGPHGMGNHDDDDQAQGDTGDEGDDDTDTQASAENSNFTF